MHVNPDCEVCLNWHPYPVTNKMGTPVLSFESNLFRGESQSPSMSGEKITVRHLPKPDQISKSATYFLVWSDICQSKEGRVCNVVLTCVVIVADVNNNVLLLGH